MNERIIQLAEQCEGATICECGSTGFDYEKFTKLIIKECLAQVDKVDSMLVDDKEKTGVAWVGLAIAKHFGIE